MSSIEALIRCGDLQREVFYASFLHHQKVGEMICVNDDGTGDCYLFERWSIHGVAFVSCFRCLSEDSLITHDISYAYVSHEVIVAEKSIRQRRLYEDFLLAIADQHQTLEEVKRKAVAAGKDPALFEYTPYTREILEEKLPPGKKTIIGDRHSTIEILERQKEIPHDLQRPRLNKYILDPGPEIVELLAMDATEENVTAWKLRHLVPTPAQLKLSTTLPFLVNTANIIPTIYDFPDKELQVL